MTWTPRKEIVVLSIVAILLVLAVIFAPRAHAQAHTMPAPVKHFHTAVASCYAPSDCGPTIAAPSAGHLTTRRRIFANKTLPFGTLVEFRYHKHICIGCCLDRGPYVSGRTFDLSPALYRKLHFFCGVGRAVAHRGAAHEEALEAVGVRLLAIDPGLANTGLVAFVDGKIVEARTIRTTGNAKHDAYEATIARVEDIEAQVADFARLFAPDVTAIESYVDLPSWGDNKRNATLRWTTPLVVYAVARVAVGQVVWQTSAVVLTQYAEYLKRWQAGFSFVPGDELLTNEHTRAAACHGLHAIASAKVARAAR